ncbi:nucleoside-diphosphate sugar epimerase [Moraxella sp. FZLJ2107]|uniref:nucleoside-diphosphate sugar epimerase n=1 Tax=unclassified Moraxella TaxID=2685852 RepID=UPI0020C8A934|nr:MULTISPECIES: nucleoside-diphosphate sugar epimerase [unclassified Moraxella]UTO06039.1 nucleoside-diphosphate sugar epimerase [Moraxella sp. FZLJ2107]UTO22776.1 nucleoside-diphosphate sugar epimerase [Moraxella sp. FZLJ2109]
MSAEYLIIGQGGVGKPLAEQLAAGFAVSAVATTPKAYAAPVRFIQKRAQDLKISDVMGVTHIAIIVTPTKVGKQATAQEYQDSYWSVCDSIAKLYQAHPVQMAALHQVLFVSSTAVYGENAGEWINEMTQANPASATAVVLRQAEQVLIDTFGDKAVIVRASGIYHINSTRLITQAKTAHETSVPSHHYTNRIMDQDLVAALAQILQSDRPKPVYLATDFLPVTSFEVLSFIADQMGYPPPKCLDGAPTGKRIISNLPRSWLSFADYRQGYQAVMDQLQE